MDEIVNKVANSKLVQLDLAAFYQHGKRTTIDIQPWLFEGLLLKEKDFRAHIQNHDWSQYQNHFVNLTCSSDAIVPSWAYLLISLELEGIAKKVVFGSLETLELALFEEFCASHDFSQYQNQLTIVKGCGNLPIPTQAYVNFMARLKPYAKSIMFGEPCSAVPLYKAPKK